MENTSRAMLRPLGNKNTNIVNKVTNRKLSNKKSTDRQQQIINCSNDNFKENVIPLDSDSLDIAVQEPLTEEKLNRLQNEIVELENVLFPCEHLLCGYGNRCQLNSLRLWLLFELEMIPDNGFTNLRNSCYHDHVYEAVCSPWKVQNCIQQKIPQDLNFEPFPLQQLIISEIKLTRGSDLPGHVNKQTDNLGEKKKIPSTSLSSQDRQNIFSSTPIDTTAVIRHRHASEASDEEAETDDDHERAAHKLRKKRRGISALERKLALIGGTSPPKLKY